MARRVRDSDLESTAARGKLKARGKPYFKSIGNGLHIGYRKGATKGVWVIRRYVGDQKYVVETTAIADDIEDANGSTVLNFRQAQERAREIAGAARYVGPYRVKDAVADYISNHLEGKSTAYDSRIRFERLVLPALGDELVDELTTERLKEWHRDLARSMPIRPRSDGVERTVDLTDPEVARRRKASANRVLTNLKSALNYAFDEGKVGSDLAWRRVKPFGSVDRARTRYLTLAECQRLLNACDGDFRSLVRGALETGARYSELCRLRVGDFNPDSGTLHIAQSKSGHGRHVILTEDGQAVFAQLTAGRPASAPMFGKEWQSTEQTRWMRLACARAKIEPPLGFHQLRHTWASHAAMSGMALLVVARNLGHTDTRMVEKHYGHLAPSYVVDQVRQHAPRFGKVESNVKANR